MERFVIGNWKMEPTLADSLVLAESVKNGLEGVGGVEVILCPPALYLSEVKTHLEPLANHLQLGAQDGFYEEAGAYTGQLSMTMLKDFCSFVLVGHSERKKYGHETAEESRKKIVAALKSELRPVVFIGEFLRPGGEKISDEAWRELEIQCEKLLHGLSREQAGRLLVVYEPVWAVGKGGEMAPTDYVGAVAERLRRTLTQYFGNETGSQIPLLYGGSVSVDNVTTVLGEAMSGVVVGRESLHAESFLAIAAVVAK